MAYDQTIRDRLERGVIEKSDSPGEVGRVYYLPHHPVIKPTHQLTKLRIVYDASAKERGESSLDDCLYRGPVLFEDLCGLLRCFRCNKVAKCANIGEAFLQVGLQPEERDVT